MPDMTTYSRTTPDATVEARAARYVHRWASRLPDSERTEAAGTVLAALGIKGETK